MAGTTSHRNSPLLPETTFQLLCQEGSGQNIARLSRVCLYSSTMVSRWSIQKRRLHHRNIFSALVYLEHGGGLPMLSFVLYFFKCFHCCLTFKQTDCYDYLFSRRLQCLPHCKVAYTQWHP